MKLSKKAQRAKELADSDILAQIVGREDIEYGEHTELPKGENVANLGRYGANWGHPSTDQEALAIDEDDD